MVAPINIGGGITVEGGISAGPDVKFPRPATLMLSLDASTYGGSGPWIDSVGSKSFTLNNSPTYSGSIGGGSFNFSPASAQWASCSTSLPSMDQWSVEVWHYYDGTNTGVDAGGVGACLVTETFTGTPSAINYSLGNDQGGLSGGPTDLQAGFWDGAWKTTGTGFTLTAGNWYQIVGTYDGAVLKLYVNAGVANFAGVAGTPISSGHGIRLMRRWDNADYWGGRLAIVKIYDGALTQSQVSASWNTNKARFGL